MDFVNSEGFKDAVGKRDFWDHLVKRFGGVEGKAYYKHPIYRLDSVTYSADFAILHKERGIVLINVFELEDDDIETQANGWVINRETGRRFNPNAELKDQVDSLKRVLSTNGQLLEICAQQNSNFLGSEFVTGFTLFPFLSDANLSKIAEGNEKYSFRGRIDQFDEQFLDKALPSFPDLKIPEVWDGLISAIQSAGNVDRAKKRDYKNPNSRGAKLDKISRQIRKLDRLQERVALQIAPGFQQIKGLAGSGKSIVLAMKAAHLHKAHPEATIVVTYLTKTLRSFLENHISFFYRKSTGAEPNWDRLRVMNSWGGYTNQGLYFEISQFSGFPFINLDDAKLHTWSDPFGYVCAEALKSEIKPQYDFILVDEAQDFSGSFLQVCKRALKDPHCLVLAQDETQVLSSLSPNIPAEAFENDKAWFEKAYEDGIPREMILKVCYRNPKSVLTFAYAMALGIYSRSGFAQILETREEWDNVGFQIIKGSDPLKEGEEVVIQRPDEFSPLKLDGGDLITIQSFDDRTRQLEWVADDILRNVTSEELLPHDVMVISLGDYKLQQSGLVELQNMLQDRGIESKIPGNFDSSRSFFTANQVTLTNARRAKGNEAPLVYVIDFDSLDGRPDSIALRNSIFTAITRVRGWCVIAGVFAEKSPALVELQTTLQNVLNESKLTFRWPRVGDIKNKIQSYRKEVRERNQARAQEGAEDLLKALSADPSVIDSLPSGVKAELLRKLAGK